MFSKEITSSARFLKMPSETQALYFHLCMNADDDWVVEAFSVMRFVWSPEDNLKLLVAKDFVKVLNDDLVTYITNWKDHNLIRADRKIDSIYKNLLLQILPNIETIVPKKRADVAKRNQEALDNQWTDNGPLSIGQDRIGKGSIVEDSLNTSTKVEEEQSSLMEEEKQDILEWTLFPVDNAPPAPPAEYTPKEITIQIDHIIEKIKESCKKYWVIYWYDSKERKYAKHILSGKFQKECLDQVWLSMDDFIDWIIWLWTKLRFWKIINSPMSLYYNWADNINKSNQQNIPLTPTKRVVILK